MSEIPTLLKLIPALPLAAAVLTALLGPRVLKSYSHLPATIAIIGSFLCSLMLVREIQIQPTPEGFERIVPIWTWAEVDGAYEQTVAADAAGHVEAVDAGSGVWRDFRVEVVLRADSLTAIMLAMVTFVSSLVVIYSVGYMHDDRGYWRFFAYVSVFVFSMTMLVSVSNFALLYVFWEAVGVCSYLLIGFWYEKPEAAAAGKKAFLVNRVGDFGFALALFLIWIYYGTLNFHDTDAIAGVLGSQRIAGQVAIVGGGIGTAICLLLLIGACGKSAQFPLHVWLPDAMEGPTPVSALIHAATMVTAGVYMVARCTPLFMASPDAQLIVAVVGGFTALLAALIAITQYDLKRVLAYSTISQLGYMFLALGCGTLAGVTAGMFHLFTHAFFKALLFLGAGSVMHAMGGVIDMRRFGGLKRLMPITHWTFLFGCLALAGVAPFAGFWSKDAVIGAVSDKVHALEAAHGAEDAGHHATFALFNAAQAVTIYQVLLVVSFVTALLTAYYTFRAYFLTFHGEQRVPHEAGHHAHESPASMTGPLVVLAGGALIVGFFFALIPNGFGPFLAQVPSLRYQPVLDTAGHADHTSIMMWTSVLAAVGFGVAAFFYLGSLRQIEWITRFLDGPIFAPYRWSRDKFYFDPIYQVLFVWPLRALAWICYCVDRWLIDGLVNLCGLIPVWGGALLRFANGGLVQFYALAMVLGVVVLIAARMILAGG